MADQLPYLRLEIVSSKTEAMAQLGKKAADATFELTGRPDEVVYITPYIVRGRGHQMIRAGFAGRHKCAVYLRG